MLSGACPLASGGAYRAGRGVAGRRWPFLAGPLVPADWPAGSGPSAQPGAANDRAWPARLPGPVPAGEGRGELKLAAPGQDRGSKAVRRRPGAASGPGIPPVTPRNAVPHRAADIIEGHPWRTAPFLTRNPAAGADYGSICSIYPARFAGSGTAVALLTHDHGPSATGTFTRSRSGTEPEPAAL
jgi:hypothetical protein